MRGIIGTLIDGIKRNVDFVIKTTTIGGTVLAMEMAILLLLSDVDKKNKRKVE